MRQNYQNNEAAVLTAQQPEPAAWEQRELTDDQRRLVVSHMPLASAMAWRMRDYGVSQEDLRQEGCMGLCEAAMRYDESVRCSFAAYAAHWCRKMMLVAISRYGTPMQLPDSQRAAARFYSLDLEENPQEDDDETATDRLLAAPFRERENEEMLRKGQIRRIDEALGCLSRKERELVRLYYGFEAERLSLTEMAVAMGISKARASSIHRRALLKLEAALRERPLVDYLTLWME